MQQYNNGFIMWRDSKVLCCNQSVVRSSVITTYCIYILVLYILLREFCEGLICFQISISHSVYGFNSMRLVREIYPYPHCYPLMRGRYSVQGRVRGQPQIQTVLLQRSVTPSYSRDKTHNHRLSLSYSLLSCYVYIYKQNNVPTVIKLHLQ